MVFRWRWFVFTGANAGQVAGEPVGGGDEEVAAAAGGVADFQVKYRLFGILTLFAFESIFNDGIQCAIEQTLDK